MDRIHLKEAAKQQISGNIAMFFVCTLIMGAVSSLSSFLVVGPILLVPPLTLGLTYNILGMTQGEKVDLGVLFSGFNRFGDAVVLYIVQSIFTFLWSLLLVVPGIIKAISYSMSTFILAEHPEMSGLEALKESQRITNGRKADLFVLYLSFIPWILLGSVTCGLAMIYVGPYMQATIANFYHEIKNQPMA